MKRYVLLTLLVVSSSVFAQPAFECVDIHGNHILTGDHGSFDKALAVGHGTYIYRDVVRSIEINVVNYKNGDGYYYGNVYTSKDYSQYYDVKCLNIKK